MGACDAKTGAPKGWAAMRPAWGETNFTNATSPTAVLISGTVNLLATWSPLVLVAADAGTYGTLDNFTEHILSASLTISANKSHVDFSWHGRNFGFTPGPSTWKGRWTLPTLNNQSVDIDPPFVYRSPHLNAALGSAVVTASYGNYTLVYNFTEDTITRRM
jgi:hypothetical protein